MSVTLSDCRVTNVSVGVVRLERYDNYSSDIYLKAADTLSIGLTPSLPSLPPSLPRTLSPAPPFHVNIYWLAGSVETNLTEFYELVNNDN